MGRGFLLLPCMLGCLPSYVQDRVEGSRKALISESIALTFNDPFVKVADPEQPVASSRSYLLRVGEQVLGYLDAPQLVPGHTMTMWYVTFGDPEKCLEPYTCNVVDFVNPRINSAFYHSGSGGTVSSEGRVRIAGYPIVNGEREKLRVGSTLKDALTSEIQMITRTHGPPIEGLEQQQLETWYGGCARTGDPRATFECYSPVYARHRAIDAQRTLANEGPMLSGEPSAEADFPLEGTHCLLARSEQLNVVMGFVDATGLTPFDVVSISWHVFNAPEACALGIGRCTIDDVANPAAEATVIDQRGGIVDEGGRLYLPVGPLRGGELGVVRVGTGEVRPSAEMVIVLRSHGPAVADRLDEQLTNYDGACDIATCVNVQFARLAPTP
jgi:hypothetical protein